MCARESSCAFSRLNLASSSSFHRESISYFVRRHRYPFVLRDRIIQGASGCRKFVTERFCLRITDSILLKFSILRERIIPTCITLKLLFVGLKEITGIQKLIEPISIYSDRNTHHSLIHVTVLISLRRDTINVHCRFV